MGSDFKNQYKEIIVNESLPIIPTESLAERRLEAHGNAFGIYPHGGIAAGGSVFVRNKDGLYVSADGDFVLGQDIENRKLFVSKWITNNTNAKNNQSQFGIIRFETGKTSRNANGDETTLFVGADASVQRAMDRRLPQIPEVPLRAGVRKTQTDPNDPYRKRSVEGGVTVVAGSHSPAIGAFAGISGKRGDDLNYEGAYANLTGTNQGAAVTVGVEKGKVLEKGLRKYALQGSLNASLGKFGHQAAVVAGGSLTGVMTREQGNEKGVDYVYATIRTDQWINSSGKLVNGNTEAQLGVGLNNIVQDLTKGKIDAASAALFARRIHVTPFTPGATEIGVELAGAKTTLGMVNGRQYTRITKAAAVRAAAYIFDSGHVAASGQIAIRGEEYRPNWLADQSLRPEDRAVITTERYNVESKDGKSNPKYYDRYEGRMNQIALDYAQNGKIDNLKFKYLSSGGYTQFDKNLAEANQSAAAAASTFAQMNPLATRHLYLEMSPRELVQASTFKNVDANSKYTIRVREILRENQAEMLDPKLAAESKTYGWSPQLRTKLRLNSYQEHPEQDSKNYADIIERFAKKGHADGKGVTFKGESWGEVGLNGKQQSAEALATNMTRTGADGFRSLVQQYNQQKPAYYPKLDNVQRARFDEILAAGTKDLTTSDGKKWLASESIAKGTEDIITAGLPKRPVQTRQQGQSQQIAKPSLGDAAYLNEMLHREKYLGDKDYHATLKTNRDGIETNAWPAKSQAALDKYRAEHFQNASRDEIANKLYARSEAGAQLGNWTQSGSATRLSVLPRESNILIHSMGENGKPLKKELDTSYMNAQRQNIASAVGVSPSQVVITGVNMVSTTHTTNLVQSVARRPDGTHIATNDSTQVNFAYTDNTGTVWQDSLNCTSTTTMSIPTGIVTVNAGPQPTHSPKPKPTIQPTPAPTKPGPSEGPTKPPTTVAPPTVAPPTVAPPTVAPPTVAPPTVAPPTVAPPTVAPPTVAPPTVAPPTVAPPTVAPPTVAPPTVAPPTIAPPQPTDCANCAPSEGPPKPNPSTRPSAPPPGPHAANKPDHPPVNQAPVDPRLLNVPKAGVVMGPNGKPAFGNEPGR